MSDTVNIGPRLRIGILARDGFKCTLCGRSVKEHGVALQVDHKLPRARGGTNHPSNLRTVCFDCNIGKQARLDSELWPLGIRSVASASRYSPLSNETIKHQHWLRQREILVAVAVEFNMEQGHAPRHTFDLEPWYGARSPEQMARKAVIETDLLHSEMSLLQPLASALSSIAAG